MSTYANIVNQRPVHWVKNMMRQYGHIDMMNSKETSKKLYVNEVEECWWEGKPTWKMAGQGKEVHV